MDSVMTSSPPMTTMATRPADTPVTRPVDSQEIELPPIDPDVRPNAIPPAVWDHLVRDRNTLERQGSVHSDSEQGRRPRYRLRYRCLEAVFDWEGHTRTRDRQRSVELGNEETARTVRRLLAIWRDEDVSLARNQRLCAAAQAEIERKARLRYEALMEDAHYEAIAEDDRRSQLSTPNPKDEYAAGELDDSTPVPQLPPALVPVPCYRQLSWREAKKFFIDCVEAPPDPDEARHALNVRALAEHHAQVAEASIPNDLLDKLLRLRGVLVEHGAILRRSEPDRKPSYRLRARAFHPDHARTHRAIPIPDDLVDSVELLLAAWRAPKRAAELRRRNTERRLGYARRGMRRLLTDLYATSQDWPTVMQEILDMASVTACLVNGEAPFRLVSV